MHEGEVVMGKKKVVLDVDTGTDDAVAILCAAASEAFDLIGVTVTCGNLPLANTVENTLRVVALSGRDIPVYAGCSLPMVRTLMPGRAHDVRLQTVSTVVDGEQISIHEPSFPLPLSPYTVRKAHACSFLVDTLRNAEEKVTIIGVAPLTNIAVALRMDPSIAANIEEIVVMGGSVASGNRTPAAEANFYDDPEAAQIVLKSGCPVRIFTLEATERVPCDHQDADDFRSLGTPAGTFVGDLIDRFIHRCTQLNICDNGQVTIHDAITVCGVIDPTIVTSLGAAACDVNLGGWADGALIADQRSFASRESSVRIVYDIDKERCVDMMKACLSKL